MGNIYETEKQVHEYLLFHYGSASEILPEDAPAGMADALDFAVRTVKHFHKPHGRALDLGCAVGRSSYELSRTCDEVIGIDYSHAFVDAAAALKKGPLSYTRKDEAHLSTQLSASLPDGVHTDKVSFEQGDAMHPRDDLGTFDCIHAANLLCRLTEPQLLLDKLPTMVNPGGQLVIATPCTWLGEFTPPENWPEGSTLDWLKQHLENNFELLEVSSEPFLIRETARKFQWTSSQVSLWGRNRG